MVGLADVYALDGVEWREIGGGFSRCLCTRWGSVEGNRVVGLADVYALDGVVWREIGW